MDVTVNAALAVYVAADGRLRSLQHRYGKVKAKAGRDALQKEIDLAAGARILAALALAAAAAGAKQ
jgi:hypothetical protein